MSLTQKSFKKFAAVSTGGWVVVVGLALSPVGCGDNSYSITYADGGETTLDASVQTVSLPVGTAGGVVTGTDGSSISIPAGALSGTQTISITPAPSTAAPAGVTAAGTPEVLGPEGLQFASPVTLTLAVDTTKLPVGKTISDIAVFTAPVGSTSFTQLAATVVDANHVSAQTTHFSVFIPGVGTLSDASAPSGDDDGGLLGDDGGIGIVDGGAAPDATTTSGDDGGGPAPSDGGGTTTPTGLQVLASGLGKVESIALVGTKLYWGDMTAGAIDVLDTAVAGSVRATVATRQPNVMGLTADATNLYFTAFVPTALDAGPEAGTSTTQATIVELPLATGSTATTLQTFTDTTRIDDVVALGGNVYYTGYDYTAPQHNVVASIAVATGEATALSATTDTNIQFGGVGSTSLVATTGTLYALPYNGNFFSPGSFSQDVVYAIPTNGSASTAFSTPARTGKALAMVSDGTTLYWTSNESGSGTATNVGEILSTPLSGAMAGVVTQLATYNSSYLQYPGTCGDAGATTGSDAGAGDSGATDSGAPCIPASTATQQNWAYGIAVDGTNVYFTTFDGTVNSVPKAGGATTVLYAEPSANTAGYWAIAVDANNVYWSTANGAGDRVLAIAK